MNKTKIICISGIIFLIFCYSLTIVLANEDSVLIGEDPEKDIKEFDIEKLEDETDYEDIGDIFDENESVLESLDDLYDVIKENWNDEDITDPIPSDEYEDLSGMDLIKIEINDLDEDNASLDFFTKGDPRDLDHFVITFWTNCSPGDNGFFGIGIVSEGIGGLETFYLLYGDDSLIAGNIDLNKDGYSIIFPSEFYKEKDNCCFKAISFVFDDPDDPKKVNIDLFNSCEPDSILDFFLEYWLIILLIAIISISALILIYYLIKRRRGIKRTKKKKTKRRARI